MFLTLTCSRANLISNICYLLLIMTVNTVSHKMWPVAWQEMNNWNFWSASSCISIALGNHRRNVQNIHINLMTCVVKLKERQLRSHMLLALAVLCWSVRCGIKIVNMKQIVALNIILWPINNFLLFLYLFIFCINPYPTAFPYGNGMVLHFYQQQESSTTKTVHKVIHMGLKTYV